MSRSTLAALVVALMLGSGIAGYLIGSPAESIDRLVPPTVASTDKPATAAPATGKSADMAPVALPKPAAAPNEPFAYRRLSIDGSKVEGEACLFFNKPLADGSSVRYEDYVRITPEAKAALHVVDDKLCIGGLDYGRDYAVRLLAGFPAKDGGKLDADQKVDVALGARPAVVSLPGRGFILPRSEAVGLPVTTVNVSKVGIAVYRVNERGLDRFVSEYADSNFPGGKPTTEGWTLRSWLNGDNGSLQWRGTMEVRNVLNQASVTAFPVRETIANWKPGAYFIVAWDAAQPPPTADNDYDDSMPKGALAGMWVVDTDIALTTSPVATASTSLPARCKAPGRWPASR